MTIRHSGRRQVTAVTAGLAAFATVGAGGVAILARHDTDAKRSAASAGTSVQPTATAGTATPSAAPTAATPSAAPRTATPTTAPTTTYTAPVQQAPVATSGGS